MSLSKRMKSIVEKVDADKIYSVADALKLVKENAKAKFDESIDAAINGIDAKKSDQLVRGAIVLPNGTVKQLKLPLWLKAMLPKLQKSGADKVGYEDLADDIKKET